MCLKSNLNRGSFFDWLVSRLEGETFTGRMKLIISLVTWKIVASPEGLLSMSSMQVRCCIVECVYKIVVSAFKTKSIICEAVEEGTVKLEGGFYCDDSNVKKTQ